MGVELCDDALLQSLFNGSAHRTSTSRTGAHAMHDRHRDAHESKRASLVRAAQLDGNGVQECGNAEAHLSPSEREQGVHPKRRRRRERGGNRRRRQRTRGDRPKRAHGRERADGQNAVVELNRGSVLKGIAPPRRERLEVVLGNDATFHQRERVECAPCVVTRDEGPAHGCDSDERSHRRDASSNHLHRIRRGVRRDGRLQQSEAAPEQTRVDGECAREVCRKAVRRHARHVVLTEILVLETASHHPPSDESLRGAHAPQQRKAWSDDAVCRQCTARGERRGGDEEDDAEHSPPHAVSVLHEIDELEFVQVHASVHLLEFRACPVLVEFAFPVFERARVLFS